MKTFRFNIMIESAGMSSLYTLGTYLLVQACQPRPYRHGQAFYFTKPENGVFGVELTEVSTINEHLRLDLQCLSKNITFILSLVFAKSLYIVTISAPCLCIEVPQK